MRWTKGKPADKAPTGVVLLVAFDFEGRRSFATAKARKGFDRFSRPCLNWAYHPSGAMIDEQPSLYWELPTS